MADMSDKQTKNIPVQNINIDHYYLTFVLHINWCRIYLHTNPVTLLHAKRCQVGLVHTIKLASWLQLAVKKHSH